MRILLVEDEMDLATALTAALSRHDIVVDHASTLEIAEEAVKRVCMTPCCSIASCPMAMGSA